MTTQRIPVEIIGWHPHAGTRGYVESTNGKIEVIKFPWGGAGMFHVTLEDDPTRTGSCYVERKDMKIIGPAVTI